MSIEINSKLCIGCGRCLEVCPGSLIRLNDQQEAQLQTPERCWGCASCIKECPAQAIAMYLGSDMGGLGGHLKVRREKTLLHWTVTRADGNIVTLTVDSQDANKY